MKTVWKFSIPVADVVEIEMPQGAEILHVNEQHHCPTIWALVDPSQPMEKRQFRFAGTGHPIQEEHIGKFIGTFFQFDGSLVFHIFETKASLDRTL